MDNKKKGDTITEHALRSMRIDVECDETGLIIDHTREDEKAMCANLRRCFGGDV